MAYTATSTSISLESGAIPAYRLSSSGSQDVTINSFLTLLEKADSAVQVSDKSNHTHGTINSNGAVTATGIVTSGAAYQLIETSGGSIYKGRKIVVSSTTPSGTFSFGDLWISFTT